MTYPKWQLYNKSTSRVDYPKNWNLSEIYAQLFYWTFDPMSLNRCLEKMVSQQMSMKKSLNRSQTSIFYTLILCKKIWRTAKSQIQWGSKNPTI